MSELKQLDLSEMMKTNGGILSYIDKCILEKLVGNEFANKIAPWVKKRRLYGDFDQEPIARY